jgi:4-amino-4-deoxy-L-arabinose transferase-like glycosyltransferase
MSKKKKRESSVHPDPEVRRHGFFDQHCRWILPGILALALILRIIAYFSLKNSIYFDFLLPDERLYHTWAEMIANGTYQPAGIYEFAPLPAYVLAFLYTVLSPKVEYFRMLNIVLGVAGCFSIYLIGREIGSRRIGLIACLVACLYEPFIFYNIVPLKTSISLVLFGFSAYFLVSVMNRPAWPRSFGLGVILGWLIYVRPNCAVLIPIMAMVLVWHYWKSRMAATRIISVCICFLIGIVLSASPFVVRNFRVSGRLALTTPQAGRNLYFANNPENKEPYYRPLSFASSEPAEQAVQFVIEASRRTDRKLSPQEASSFWAREVFRLAFKEPWMFTWRMLQKTFAFFNRFEAGDHYHIGFMSRFVPFFKLPFITLGMILPFAMAGMVFKTRRSEAFRALILIFFAYAATIIVFNINTRYRLPVMMILIPFAVIGLEQFFLWIKEKNIRGILKYMSIAILFFIIECLPIAGTEDMTAYYNAHALILNANGNETEAIIYWEKASMAERPYSAFSNLFLAGKYFDRGTDIRAFAHIDKIPDHSFAAAAKYALVGDIMAAKGKVKEAITAYEKSLQINSGQRRIRKELFRLYWKTDKQKALDEYKKLKYISSFYHNP